MKTTKTVNHRRNGDHGDDLLGNNLHLMEFLADILSM